MTSSPGFPSADPAAFVPVTLVEGALDTPATPAASSAPSPPAPRRPPDPVLGPASAVPGPAPAAARHAPAPHSPGLPPMPGRVHATPGPAPALHRPASAQRSPVPAFPGGTVMGPFPGFHGPAPAGVPPHLAAALNRPTRPGTVTAAGVLWILVAAVDALFALIVLATGALPVVVAVLGLVLGAATAALAVAMLRGSDAARTAVTILGGVAGGVVLLPLLLFVPAVIVTLHPSSTAWFADARQRRTALR